MVVDPLSLAVPGVRGLRPYEPGKPIEELEREYGISNAIKLASNENPLGPGPKALAAIRDWLPELGRYPDGNGFALKRSLADKLAVAPEQLTLGNGSNEVLELIARAFVLPENEVVFSEHAFAVYALVTQAVGATARVVPARDWGHDLEGMARAINTCTRVVFVANPNNPTGTWVTTQALEQLLQATSPEVLVVVDEAYFEYVDQQDYPNTIPWVQRFPNLIVTRTFSKVHGLAGLRVGFGVSHPEIADLLNRVREPFNVNSLALTAAQAALDDDAHVSQSVTMNRGGLQQLSQGFSDLGLAYIPSVGNFVSVDVGRSGTEVFAQLLPEGVIVRPIANYGLANHIRVTIGREQENARFLDALKKVL